MLRIKRIVCMFVLILCVCGTGCVRTQPVLQDCNSSVIKINDENVDGKFETVEIEASDEEISEEMEYRLIQYSELKNIGKDIIDIGDIVYISVTWL